MQCDACRREAIVFQPYSGKYLCPVHFTKDFETKAKRTIRSHSWLHPGDHIAVTLSGDALGTALLLFLSKLTANRRDIQLSAITVDPGIPGYPVTEYSQKTAAACGVELFTGSFSDRYGITADEIARQDGKEAAGRSCRVLGGDLIREIAQAHGVTRCAVATTVDEIAGDFFSDLLAGTVEHSLFSREPIGTKPAPFIRPFMAIPTPEVIRYAELHAPAVNPSCFLPRCSFAVASPLVADAQDALDAYDSKHPATKFALANLAGTLAGFATRYELSVCPVCSGPLTGGECKGCATRRRLR